VRYALPIVGLLLLIGALVAIKFTQIATLIHFGKAMQQAGPPPESVSTSVSQRAEWEGTLEAVGSVAAARGVVVSNDSPGIVSRILFDSGAAVRQGQTLVELDTSVERAQLASARARLDLAEITAGRSRALLDRNAVPKSQVDNDDSLLKSATTDFGALQAQIDRKIVRAPFAGRLGIRQVNLGQYLTSGSAISVLESFGTVFIDFELPQQRLGDIQIGMPVRVTLTGVEGVPREGVVAAVDPSIDSTTRTIKVRASIPNNDDDLRPGMFANVSVLLPKKDSLVVVPSTALVHASYGDSVFVVEDPKDDSGAGAEGSSGGDKRARVARQQFVRVGRARGDFVSILDGVGAGQEIVSSGAFKLRNGSGVVVHNDDVKLDPQLNPHPENR
jgi:membrane fusion protein (multidrug efflux system)